MLSPVLKTLSNSNKYYCLTKSGNNSTIDTDVLYANHIHTKVSAIKSIQHQLESLTPVNASSLYWLI